MEVLYPDEVLRPQLLENDAREELVDVPIAMPLLETELAAPDEVVRKRPEPAIRQAVIRAADVALGELHAAQHEGRVVGWKRDTFLRFLRRLTRPGDPETAAGRLEDGHQGTHHAADGGHEPTLDSTVDVDRRPIRNDHQPTIAQELGDRAEGHARRWYPQAFRSANRP